jgi:hypothetical protein
MLFFLKNFIILPAGPSILACLLHHWRQAGAQICALSSKLTHYHMLKQRFLKQLVRRFQNHFSNKFVYNACYSLIN